MKATGQPHWPCALAAVTLTWIIGCRHSPLEISGWVVDWNPEQPALAVTAVDTFDGTLTEIDFFRLHFRPDGSIASGRPSTAAHRRLDQIARKRRMRRLVTLVNDTVSEDGSISRAKDPEIVHSILTSPPRRDRLIRDVRLALEREHYDGLDLDFENLRASDRQAFSRFVAELGTALRAEERRLVVTVHPRTREETRDGPGAQDLEELSRSADEIRVMAYHRHYAGTAPGPSAPLPWVEKVLDHFLRSVPPERLSLALYAGGWMWSGTGARQTTYAQALDLSRSLGAPIRWSAPDQVPFVRGRSAAGEIEIWFENGCSLWLKTKLAAARGIRRIALWHLATADPRQIRLYRARTCVTPVVAVRSSQ